MKLKGKVALVTGAAQGIGRTIAEALAREGAKVALADINFALVEATAASFTTPTLPLALNVADTAACEAAVKQTAEKFGRIDIVVNNAGITRDALLMRMKEADWDMVIAVNLKSVFNLTRAVSPLLMKQKSGTIINIASIVGQMGNAGQANYSASKGGVIALTKTAARELAPRGITVNAIAPGFIDTDMTRKLPEDIKNKLKEQIPLGILGQPEDIAKTVLFLAADAPYITGQVIAVNGGMYM
mgnify:CR=1 FL=1